MSKLRLLFLGLLLCFHQLRAHEMNYVSCSPGDIGCFVGRYSLGAGVGWSRFRKQTAFWPHGQLEVGLLNHIALEVSVGGINSQQLYQSLSATPSLIFGGGLQLYPNGLYRGLVWKGAIMAHLYRQDLSNQRYSTETAFLSTLGWRWRPKDYGGSFALGLGIQKVLGQKRLIQPVVETQIAVDFNLESIFF